MGAPRRKSSPGWDSYTPDTRVREDYPRRDLLKGRAEAEVIMGALEELRQALEAQGG